MNSGVHLAHICKKEMGLAPAKPHYETPETWRNNLGLQGAPVALSLSHTHVHMHIHTHMHTQVQT